MSGMDENGFLIKRADEIKLGLEESVRASLGSDLSLLPDTIEGQIIDIFTRIYSDMWEELFNAYSAFNPISVTGQALDNLSLLNGLERLPPSKSRALLSLAGVDTTVIPAGSIVKHSSSGTEFITEVSVTISAGVASVYASSSFNGSIQALAGTLTVIETPVNGWSTAINSFDAIIGRLAETDSQLRSRRARSLALSGLSSMESIVSAIQAINGVSFSGVEENYTDLVDSNGLPPHSFETIVLGGDDTAIAQAIWEKKPAGIEPFGSSTANATDIFGGVHAMGFSRPLQITLYLRANITFIGKAPDDASAVLTQAILDFVNGVLISGQEFTVGDDIIYSRMYMPFNYTYPNLIINSLDLSVDGILWNPTDVAIAYNEISAWDAARILLTL